MGGPLRITHMTKVAVTGGAGFIGSNLTKRLLSEGYEVTVVDDLSTGLLSNVDQETTTFHRVSITDPMGLAAALKDSETIFHLAARGSVPRSIKNPVATHDVNATGTLNVLEVGRTTGAHVIFSSSSSVYGRNMALPKDNKAEPIFLTPPITSLNVIPLDMTAICFIFSETPAKSKFIKSSLTSCEIIEI